MLTTRPLSRFVQLSARVYRFMLLVYPAHFRQEYGEWMLQLFTDHSTRITAREGLAGLLALWLRTFADLFLSLVEQYSNRGVGMTKSRWIKLSGWLLMAGGLTLFLGWLASSRPEYSQYNAASWQVDRFLNAAAYPLAFLGFLMTTTGLFGLRARFSAQSSPLGRAGYLISIFGGLLAMPAVAALDLTDSGPWWQITMLAVTVLYLGLAFFGLDSLRHTWFARWSFLPLLASLPWLLGIAVSLASPALTGRFFQMPAALNTLIFILTFGGLALTGYLVQASTVDQPSISAA